MFVDISVYLVEGPGMSFASGRAYPKASQKCCDTPTLFGKDIL